MFAGAGEEVERRHVVPASTRRARAACAGLPPVHEWHKPRRGCRAQMRLPTGCSPAVRAMPIAATVLPPAYEWNRQQAAHARKAVWAERRHRTPVPKVCQAGAPFASEVAFMLQRCLVPRRFAATRR